MPDRFPSRYKRSGWATCRLWPPFSRSQLSVIVTVRCHRKDYRCLRHRILLLSPATRFAKVLFIGTYVIILIVNEFVYAFENHMFAVNYELQTVSRMKSKVGRVRESMRCFGNWVRRSLRRQPTGQLPQSARVADRHQQVCQLAHQLSADQQCDADNEADCADNRPFRLGRHEAAGQDVDSLQKPNHTNDDEYHSENRGKSLHGELFVAR